MAWCNVNTWRCIHRNPSHPPIRSKLHSYTKLHHFYYTTCTNYTTFYYTTTQNYTAIPTQPYTQAEIEKRTYFSKYAFGVRR